VGRVLAAYGPDFGSRVTVASMSGGLGIMLTDAIASSGLQMASWPPQQQRVLDGLLPAYLSRRNPIDVAGVPFFDLEVLEALLHAMDDNPASDVAVLAVCNFEQLQTAISDRITTVHPTLRKPVFVVWLGGEDAVRRLNRAGIPSFPDSDRCVRAISLVAGRRPGSIVTAPVRPTNAAPVRAHGEVSAALSDPSDLALLARFGIPVARSRVVSSPADALEALAGLRLPLVAKLVSPLVPHKSDVGAVLLDLLTPDAVSSAVVRLLNLRTALGARDGHVVLQEQADAGVELLIGMKQDPVFGAVITLGIGGVYAEAFDDVQVRLHDLDYRDVEDMLSQLTHRRLLSGFRGLPAITAERLAPLLTAFTRLVREVGGHFAAIDVNPVLVPRDGSEPIAVDVLFVPAPGNSHEN